MNILFVLPDYKRAPVGGYKIIFEYANRLSARGHGCSFLFLNEFALKKYKLPLFARKALVNYFVDTEPKWFPLSSAVKKYSIYRTSPDDITADAVIATAVETVEFTKDNFGDTPKFYFIQDFEDWNRTKEYVEDTYRLDLGKIVISNWLKETVDKFSPRESCLISNPLDLEVFSVKTPIDRRNKHTVGLLYSAQERKGLKYSMAALDLLKKEYPDLTVYAFGGPPRPESMPDWYKYTHKAKQQQVADIYNSVSVYLSASLVEGFGLTGLESMACGDALVTTESLGVREYARDGETALMVPVKDVGAIVEKIKYLFENDDERQRIARTGAASVKDRSWDNAVSEFEKALGVR